jgi:hypothetical protein
VLVVYFALTSGGDLPAQTTTSPDLLTHETVKVADGVIAFHCPRALLGPGEGQFGGDHWG